MSEASTQPQAASLHPHRGCCCAVLACSGAPQSGALGGACWASSLSLASNMAPGAEQVLLKQLLTGEPSHTPACCTPHAHLPKVFSAGGRTERLGPGVWNKKQPEPWGSDADQRPLGVCEPSASAQEEGGQGWREPRAVPGRPHSQERPVRPSCLTAPSGDLKGVTNPKPSLRALCWDLLQHQYCSWSCRGL